MRARHDEHAGNRVAVLAGGVELVQRALNAVALVVLRFEDDCGARESVLRGEAQDAVALLAPTYASGGSGDFEYARSTLRRGTHEGHHGILEVESAPDGLQVLRALRFDPRQRLANLLLELRLTLLGSLRVLVLSLGLLLEQLGQGRLQNRHRGRRSIRVHCDEHLLARRLGLADQSAQQRALVVRVQGRQCRRQLLLAALVRPLQLFAQTPQESRDGAVFGQGVQRPHELRMAVAHDRRELRLQNLDEPCGLGRAELLEQGARFTDLPGERFRDDAVLWSEVLLELPSQHPLVIKKRCKPLMHLAVGWIEETRQHRSDGRLLVLDVETKLVVDVVQEIRSDILELGLLGGSVRVSERAQSDPPGIEGELVAPRLVQVGEQGQALGAPIAKVDCELLGREGDADIELRIGSRGGHGQRWSRYRAKEREATQRHGAWFFPGN